MLKTSLLHPDILQALGAAGHGARVLIADGNYPCSTEAPPGARRVYLNLRPGVVGVAEVLETLVAVIPIEAAVLMEPAEGTPVPLHERLRATLPATAQVSTCRRQEFYAEAKLPATTLVIATAEERRFANVLLTMGVVSREVI